MSNCLRIIILSCSFVALVAACCGQEPEHINASVEAARRFLADPDDPFHEFARQPFATTPLSKSDAREFGQLLWNTYKQHLMKKRHAEWQNKIVKTENLEMRFEYKVFGKQPKAGRSLFISLHGGGGTEPQINEQQWKNQIELYQPEEGVYLAPRAPTDAWNMWHQPHIDWFFERIIQNAILFENVNPDRVYLMGYSAGGDGVYQLAPRMADYLAAAAMMAGHPNDASPLGLRNIGFTIHMGGRDSAYNRNSVARQWKTRLAELRKSDPNGYRHQVVIHEQKGHWMQRKDAAAMEWMAEFTRDTRPEKVVWRQNGVVHDNFYWLAVAPEKAKPESTVIVSRGGQKFIVELADSADELIILLNDQIVDLDKPVLVEFNGRCIFNQKVNRTAATLLQSIRRRFDPELVYSAQIKLSLETSGTSNE